MNNRKTLSKVFKYIGNYKFLLLLALFLSVLIVATTLYIPILVGDAIDLIVGPNNVDFEQVISILIRAAITIFITAICQWITSSINNRMTYHIVRDLREDAFSKITKLPLSYLDIHPQGEIISKVITDVDQFADGLLLGFTQMFTGVLTILGTLVFMFIINWKIALVVLILTPLSLLVAKFISSRTYNMFKLQSKTRGEQTSLIDEVVENQKVVRAFGKEEDIKNSFEEINERLRKCSLKAIFFSSLTNPATRFVNSIVYAAVALVGALTAISTVGEINPFTIGMLSCLLSYTNQYTKPFNEISGVITEFQNALACAGRVFEFLEEDEETDDSKLNSMESCEGSINIDDVSFSYVENKPLIEHLSIEVKPGQRIAIVGPTGCGKTTFINLLMRFYDVNSGKITVDNNCITEIKRKSLRKNYGMVLQDTWLKSGTIRENIIMGKPDATDEEIIAAAKAAHAHSFIKRLENGYDTVIGESGGSLSNGQKQLLCITRIMLCLPPMLILDEATSSIDTRTEIKIQEAFSKMMSGRTCFVVAHRLSTIQNSDLILVMNKGQVIEQGTHNELLDKKGFYYNLYNSQFAH